MGRRRGGTSVAVRVELAQRLGRGHRFQPHLARQHANQLADAMGDNLNKCTTTSQWVGKEANNPSGSPCFVARAIEDQLAGNGIEACTGARRGHAANTSGACALGMDDCFTDWETATCGVNATPIASVGEIATHGETAAQQGAKAVPRVNATVNVSSDEMIDVEHAQQQQQHWIDYRPSLESKFWHTSRHNVLSVRNCLSGSGCARHQEI